MPPPASLAGRIGGTAYVADPADPAAVEALDDADRRIFERASVVTPMLLLLRLLLLRRSVEETENRVRGRLLADLLTSADRDPATLTAAGRRLGVDLNRPHLVLVAETEPAARARLAGAAAGPVGLAAAGPRTSCTSM